MLSMALALLAAAPPPGANRIVPTYRTLATTGTSSLYEAVLPANASYAAGAPLVIKLRGSRKEVGRAYAVLLGNRSIDVFETFLEYLFPSGLVRAAFEEFADWLWKRFAAPHVPAEYLEELEAMRAASPPGRRVSVDMVTRRFNVLANLPADPQNIITMLEQELEHGLPSWEAHLLNRIINHLDGCTWCDEAPDRGQWRSSSSSSSSSDGRSDGRSHGRQSRTKRLPSAPRCDAYAAWGSRTHGGRLFASRNLDWKKNTGIAASKLVAVYDIAGTQGPYATFGFASGFGALAGMSRNGVTVAEMNLDNALTTFDGPPFPMRLRHILEQATSLASAKGLWEASNNTDSMNYMLTSSTETAALAVEAIGGRFAPTAPHAAYSAFFTANDTVEAHATCAVGTDGKAGECGTGAAHAPLLPGGRAKRIGSPKPEAVWRTNHALHPTVLATQEPLFNDTTFRYALLASEFDRLASTGAHAIDDAHAVGLAATLGIKGPNYLSCEPDQFASGTHVMSVVYVPKRAARKQGEGEDEEEGEDDVDDAHAWVAWEDASPAGEAWRPAACNPYVRIDLAGGFW